MWHILPPGIRAAGQFILQVQESARCYGPKVRKVTPGSYALHNLVNKTSHHTYTHILGTLASFGGIPVLRRSLPLKTAVYGPRRVYPPIFLRAKFQQCT